VNFDEYEEKNFKKTIDTKHITLHNTIE